MVLFSTNEPYQLPSACLLTARTTFRDESVSAFVITSFKSFSRFTPRRYRVATTSCTTFTTTVWVVDRVHCSTAVVRTFALPTSTTGFTCNNTFVLSVTHLADSCVAVEVDKSNFTR